MTDTNTRTCGECMLCCFTHAVASVQKKSMEWCTHCIRGQGCGIYADRPLECEHFGCTWLSGEGTTEQRPDKTQIVMYRKYTGQGMTVMMVEEVKGALESEFGRKATAFYAKARVPIHQTTAGGRKSLVFQKGIVLEDSFLKRAKREGVAIEYVETS